jgi:DHA1 family multidrug resistance protein-like MFS transporter
VADSITGHQKNRRGALKIDSQEAMIPGEEHWQRNARTLTAGNVILNAGWVAAFAFLPLVVQGMGVGDRLAMWVGAIMFGYYAMSCIMTPIWGVLADHYGRKSMVLRAAFIMGVGFTLLTFVTDPLLFLLLMTVIGMGNGYIPAGMALIATTTPSRHMGGALALAQSGAWIGTMIGPLAGAALISFLPEHRILFAVTGLTIVIAGLMALFFVHEIHVRPDHPLRFNLRADLTRLLQVSQLGRLYYTSFLFAATVFGSNTVVSLLTLQMLEERPGFGNLGLEAWIAITAMGLTVASIAALPVWGRLLNRHDPAKLLRIQLAGGLATSLILPLVRDPLELAVVRMLFGVFIAGLPPTVIRMVRERAPKGMEGRALSYGTALQNIGSGGAPLVAGLLAPYIGLRGFFWLASGMILIGLVLWMRRPRS